MFITGQVLGSASALQRQFSINVFALPALVASALCDGEARLHGQELMENL